MQTDSDIADIKKARLLLKSVTQTNPNHGPGWIAAARLEELAGMIPPTIYKLDSLHFRLLRVGFFSENVHHFPFCLSVGKLSTAREMVALGCRHCPKSEDIWLEAVRLEMAGLKRSLLSKAIQQLPNSVRDLSKVFVVVVLFSTTYHNHVRQE